MFLFVLLLYYGFCFFFFKQKTAYEMRISDWSSDVCSSDLYGALSTPGGEVHIGWDVMREDGQVRLRMKWVERGGPPVTPPARRGFGTRMIERGLAAELGGKAEILFKPEGLECVVARSEATTSELTSLMRIS